MGGLSLPTLYGDIAMDLFWHVHDFSVEYKPFDSDPKVDRPDPTIHHIHRLWVAFRTPWDRRQGNVMNQGGSTGLRGRRFSDPLGTQIDEYNARTEKAMNRGV
jgi:hypothetical protein